MGYHTRFRIHTELDLKEDLEAISGYLFEYGGSSYYTGDIKWYNYQDHLKEISKGLDGEVLVVSGEGEEQGDTWMEYFKDGKSARYTPKITFPELDEEDLK